MHVSSIPSPLLDSARRWHLPSRICFFAHLEMGFTLLGLLLFLCNHLCCCKHVMHNTREQQLIPVVHMSPWKPNIAEPGHSPTHLHLLSAAFIDAVSPAWEESAWIKERMSLICNWKGAVQVYPQVGLPDRGRGLQTSLWPCCICRLSAFELLGKRGRGNWLLLSLAHLRPLLSSAAFLSCCKQLLHNNTTNQGVIVR